MFSEFLNYIGTFMLCYKKIMLDIYAEENIISENGLY